MMDTIMEYMDFPIAWKQPPNAIEAPAMQKLREMIRRAGIATASMVAEELKIFSSVLGMVRKTAMPINIMADA